MVHSNETACIKSGNVEMDPFNIVIPELISFPIFYFVLFLPKLMPYLSLIGILFIF